MGQPIGFGLSIEREGRLWNHNLSDERRSRSTYGLEQTQGILAPTWRRDGRERRTGPASGAWRTRHHIASAGASPRSVLPNRCHRDACRASDLAARSLCAAQVSLLPGPVTRVSPAL